MARPRRGEFEPKLSEFRRRAGLTQERVAQLLSVSAETVRRHERGTALPIPLYRAKYCDLYGASEEELGLRPVTPGAVSSVRPTFLVPAASKAAALVDAGDFADETYLESVRSHIHEIVALDNRFGGGDLVRLSSRFFHTVHNKIGAGAFEPRIERDLYAVAGELAEVVGWLAYDAEQHDLVRRMNQESLYFTTLAGDRMIGLLTLQNASMHAGALGRPYEALQIARSVLEGSDGLSPRLRALFLTRKARALAQGGAESALRIFGEVRALYLDGVRDRDPAWAWWVDERELAWHEAMALRDMGRPGEALAHFERSVLATPPTEVRSQYLHRAYLLYAQVEACSWCDIEQSVRQLRPLAEEVASLRTVVLLRKAIDAANTSRNIPAGVLEQISELAHILHGAPV
jgi:DNA-binding XRE family transcriptional regulator